MALWGSHPGQHRLPAQCLHAGQGQGRGTDTSQQTHQTRCRPPPGRRCRCHSPCRRATGRCKETCVWSRRQTPDRTRGGRGDTGCQGVQSSFTRCRARGAPGEPAELLAGRGISRGQTKSVTRARKALWHCRHQLCRGQGSMTGSLSWQCPVMKRLYVPSGQSQGPNSARPAWHASLPGSLSPWR